MEGPPERTMNLFLEGHGTENHTGIDLVIIPKKRGFFVCLFFLISAFMFHLCVLPNLQELLLIF